MKFKIASKLPHAALVALLGLALFAGFSAHAKEQSISCRSEERMPGGFWLHLDDKYFDKNSGFSAIINASWTYNYSSARLICDSHMISVTKGKLEQLSCIGYMDGSGGRIEFKGSLTNGVGTIRVHNIDRNPYNRETNGLKLECGLIN